MTLKVLITHKHSKNRDNIIFDGAYESWLGAIPRQGEYIDISDDLRVAYKIPKSTFAHIQTVIWSFDKDLMTVYGEI